MSAAVPQGTSKIPRPSGGEKRSSPVKGIRTNTTPQKATPLVQQLREEISQLKRKLDEESSRVKHLKREKVKDVQQVRSEERERCKDSLADQKYRLQQERDREIEGVRAQLAKHHASEISKILRERQEFSKASRDADRERAAFTQRLREQILAEAKEEAKQSFAAERSRFIQESEELNRIRRQLEDELSKSKLEIRHSSEDLRRLTDDHQRELESLKKDARKDIIILIDEIKAKDRTILELEKELGHQAGYTQQLAAERDSTREELNLSRLRETWERRDNNSRKSSSKEVSLNNSTSSETKKPQGITTVDIHNNSDRTENSSPCTRQASPKRDSYKSQRRFLSQKSPMPKETTSARGSPMPSRESPMSSRGTPTTREKIPVRRSLPTIRPESRAKERTTVSESQLQKSERARQKLENKCRILEEELRKLKPGTTENKQQKRGDPREMESSEPDPRIEGQREEEMEEELRRLRQQLDEQFEEIVELKQSAMAERKRQLSSRRSSLPSETQSEYDMSLNSSLVFSEDGFDTLGRSLSQTDFESRLTPASSVFMGDIEEIRDLRSQIQEMESSQEKLLLKLHDSKEQNELLEFQLLEVSEAEEPHPQPVYLIAELLQVMSTYVQEHEGEKMDVTEIKQKLDQLSSEKDGQLNETDKESVGNLKIFLESVEVELVKLHNNESELQREISDQVKEIHALQDDLNQLLKKLSDKEETILCNNKQLDELIENEFHLVEKLTSFESEIALLEEELLELRETNRTLQPLRGPSEVEDESVLSKETTKDLQQPFDVKSKETLQESLEKSPISRRMSDKEMDGELEVSEEVVFSDDDSIGDLLPDAEMSGMDSNENLVMMDDAKETKSGQEIHYDSGEQKGSSDRSEGPKDAGDLKERFKILEDNCKKLESQKAELELEGKELDRVNGLLESKVAELEENERKVSQVISDQMVEIQGLKQELEEYIPKDAYDRHVKEEQKEQKLRDPIIEKEALDKIAAAGSERAVMEDTLRASEAEEKSLHVPFDRVKLSQFDDEGAQSKMTEMHESDLEKAIERHKSVQHSVDVLEMQQQDLKEALKELADEKDKLEKKVSELSEQKENMESDLLRAKEELQRISEEREALQTLLGELDKRRVSFPTTKDVQIQTGLDAEKEALIGEVAELKERIDILEHEKKALSEVQDNCNKRDVLLTRCEIEKCDLQKNLDEVESAKDALAHELKDQLEQNRKLLEEKEMTTNKMLGMESAITELKSCNAVLEEKSEQERLEFVSKNEFWEGKCQGLKGQNDNLSDELERLKRTEKELEEKVREMTENNEQREQKWQNDFENIVKKQHLLEKSEVSEREERLRSLMEEVKIYQEKDIVSSEKMSEMKSAIATLERRIADKEEALFETEEKAKTLAVQNGKLSQESEQLSRKERVGLKDRGDAHTDTKKMSDMDNKSDLDGKLAQLTDEKYFLEKQLLAKDLEIEEFKATEENLEKLKMQLLDKDVEAEKLLSEIENRQTKERELEDVVNSQKVLLESLRREVEQLKVKIAGCEESESKFLNELMEKDAQLQALHLKEQELQDQLRDLLSEKVENSRRHNEKGSIPELEAHKAQIGALEDELQQLTSEGTYMHGSDDNSNEEEHDERGDWRPFSNIGRRRDEVLLANDGHRYSEGEEHIDRHSFNNVGGTVIPDREGSLYSVVEQEVWEEVEVVHTTQTLMAPTLVHASEGQDVPDNDREDYNMKLNQKIEALEAEIHLQKTMLEEEVLAKESLQEEVTKMLQSESDLKEQLSTLSEQNDGLQENLTYLSQVETEIGSLKILVEKLTEEKKDLKQQLNDAEIFQGGNSGRLEEKSKEFDRMKEEVDKMLAERERLMERVQEMESNMKAVADGLELGESLDLLSSGPMQGLDKVRESLQMESSLKDEIRKLEERNSILEEELGDRTRISLDTSELGSLLFSSDDESDEEEQTEETMEEKVKRLEKFNSALKLQVKHLLVFQEFGPATDSDKQGGNDVEVSTSEKEASCQGNDEDWIDRSLDHHLLDRNDDVVMPLDGSGKDECNSDKAENSPETEEVDGLAGLDAINEPANDEELRQQLALSEENNKLLEQQLEDLRQLMQEGGFENQDVLIGKVEMLEQSQKKLHGEIESLKKDLADKDEELRNTQSELLNTENKFSLRVSELEESEQRLLEGLDANNERWKREAESTMERISELESLKGDLRKKLSLAEEQLEELQATSNLSNTQNSGMSLLDEGLGALDIGRTSFEDIDEDDFEVGDVGIHTEMEEVLRSMENDDGTNGDWTVEKDQLNQRIKELEKSEVELMEKVAFLEDKESNKSDLCEQLEKDLEVRMGEVTALKETLKIMGEQNLEQPKVEQSTLEAEIRHLQEQVSFMEEERAKLLTKIQEFSPGLDDVEDHQQTVDREDHYERCFSKIEFVVSQWQSETVMPIMDKEQPVRVCTVLNIPYWGTKADDEVIKYESGRSLVNSELQQIAESGANTNTKFESNEEFLDGIVSCVETRRPKVVEMDFQEKIMVVTDEGVAEEVNKVPDMEKRIKEPEQNEVILKDQIDQLEMASEGNQCGDNLASVVQSLAFQTNKPVSRHFEEVVLPQGLSKTEVELKSSDQEEVFKDYALENQLDCIVEAVCSRENISAVEVSPNLFSCLEVDSKNVAVTSWDDQGEAPIEFTDDCRAGKRIQVLEQSEAVMIDGIAELEMMLTSSDEKKAPAEGSEGHALKQRIQELEENEVLLNDRIAELEMMQSAFQETLSQADAIMKDREAEYICRIQELESLQSQWTESRKDALIDSSQEGTEIIKDEGKEVLNEPLQDRNSSKFQLQESYNTNVQNFKDRIEELENTEMRLMNELEQSLETEEKLKDELMRLGNLFSDLTEDIAEGDSVDMEIDPDDFGEKIESRAKLIKEQNRTLATELTEKENELEEWKENVNILEENKRRFNSEMEEIQGLQSAQGQELSMVKEELSAKEVLAEEMDKKVKFLEKDVDNLRMKLESENQKADTARREVDRLREEKRKMERDLENSQKTLEIIERISADENKDRHDEVWDKEEQYNDNKMLDLKKEAEALQEELHLAQIQIEDLKRGKIALEEQLRKLRQSMVSNNMVTLSEDEYYHLKAHSHAGDPQEDDDNPDATDDEEQFGNAGKLWVKLDQTTKELHKYQELYNTTIKEVGHLKQALKDASDKHEAYLTGVKTSSGFTDTVSVLIHDVDHKIVQTDPLKTITSDTLQLRLNTGNQSLPLQRLLEAIPEPTDLDSLSHHHSSMCPPQMVTDGQDIYLLETCSREEDIQGERDSFLKTENHLELDCPPPMPMTLPPGEPRVLTAVSDSPERPPLPMEPPPTELSFIVEEESILEDDLGGMRGACGDVAGATYLQREEGVLDASGGGSDCLEDLRMSEWRKVMEEAEELKEKVGDLQRELKAKDAELHTMQEEKDELSCVAKEAQEGQQFKQKLMEKELELAERAKEITHLKIDLKKSEAEMLPLKLQLDRLQDQYKDREQNLRSMEAEKDRMKERLKDKERALFSKEREVDDLEQQVKALQEDWSSREDQAGDENQKSEMKYLREQNERLKGQIDQLEPLKERMTNLERQLERGMKQAAESPTRKPKQRTHEEKRLSEDNVCLQRRINQLEEEKEYLDRLAADYKNMKDRFSDLEYKKYEAELSVAPLKAKVSYLTKKFNEKDALLRKMAAELAVDHPDRASEILKDIESLTHRLPENNTSVEIDPPKIGRRVSRGLSSFGGSSPVNFSDLENDLDDDPEVSGMTLQHLISLASRPTTGIHSRVGRSPESLSASLADLGVIERKRSKMSSSTPMKTTSSADSDDTLKGALGPEEIDNIDLPLQRSKVNNHRAATSSPTKGPPVVNDSIDTGDTTRGGNSRYLTDDDKAGFDEAGSLVPMGHVADGPANGHHENYASVHSHNASYSLPVNSNQSGFNPLWGHNLPNHQSTPHHGAHNAGNMPLTSGPTIGPFHYMPGPVSGPWSNGSSMQSSPHIVTTSDTLTMSPVTQRPFTRVPDLSRTLNILPSGVPDPPRVLKVARVVSGQSALLIWKPPLLDRLDCSNGHKVAGYKIFINARPKQFVTSPNLTKALVTNVDLLTVRTFGIQSVSVHGKGSFIREIPFALPQQRVPHMASDSSFSDSAREPSSGLSSSVVAAERPKQRMFMAVYSYNPFEHSPNQNPESELSFSEGDLIKVKGHVRSDGFYHGMVNGKKGLVPSNFIEEISVSSSSRKKKRTIPSKLPETTTRQDSRVGNPQQRRAARGSKV